MRVLVYSCGFFFFKQKTAYEMRISDWSSDVCSSDLRRNGMAAGPDLGGPPLAVDIEPAAEYLVDVVDLERDVMEPDIAVAAPDQEQVVVVLAFGTAHEGRSEEHTSELQSLKRISYAVFCLKKKKEPEKSTQQQA